MPLDLDNRLDRVFGFARAVIFVEIEIERTVADAAGALGPKPRVRRQNVLDKGSWDSRDDLAHQG